MKILIVPGNDWVSGPKQYLNDIAEILGKKHEIYVWRFELFVHRKPFKKKIENVKILNLPSIHSDNLLMYYIANLIPHSVLYARVVRRLGIDVVVALNLVPALWAFLLSPPGTLRVYGLQDYFPESASVYYKSYPKVLRRILESWALLVNKLGVRLADLTISPCFSLVDVAGKMGCKRNFFLPNGVDTNLFSPSKPDESLKEKLGTTKNTLVFFGLIEKWLDFDTMFDGLRILKKEFPDLKLLIVGSPLTDYAKDLEKMIADRDLTDSVVMTGFVPEEHVPRYLSLGSACLMPYRVDEFSGKVRLPIKFYIYSASGKPILSVLLPEVKRTGAKHIFYYHDGVSFAKSASLIFKNEELRKSMEHFSRDFAMDFDYSRLAQKCETILEQERLRKKRKRTDTGN